MRRTDSRVRRPRPRPHGLTRRRRGRCRRATTDVSGDAALGGAVGLDPARRPAQPVRRRPVLGDGGAGRQLSRDRLPHPRGDGRLLDAADQAAGRHLVPRRGRLADGRQVHQRLGLPADGPRHPRRRADHAAPTSRPTACAPGWSGCGSTPTTATTMQARRRRPLRADEGLPLGRDHAQPDDVQPARHRCGRRPRTSSSASRARRRPTARRTTTPPSSARPWPRRHRPRARPPRSAGHVECPASGPDTPTPPRCDDTATARAPAAQLTLRRGRADRAAARSGSPIGGSDKGLAEAHAAQQQALANPAGAARAEARRRGARSTRTAGSAFPATGCSSAASQWSKQNLAESVQESRDLRGPDHQRRQELPAAGGHVRQGALVRRRLPRLPVAVRDRRRVHQLRRRQQPASSTPIKAHLRALRDVSVVANGRSGKVVHEVTPDGQVYFGANTDAGNTDETAKFPSTVALVWRWTGDDAFRDEMYPFAVRNMRYIYRELDADGDGWPEGLGNVEREGMGEEKLDNTVYTIRGLRDLADLAASKGDGATRSWATGEGRRPASSGSTPPGGTAPTPSSTPTRSTNPGNEQVFQRHWIGVTPAEVELKRPGRPDGPLASLEHAQRARREARGALLHRRVRALPHRHRAHLGRGRQPGSLVRQRDLLGAVRAVGVHPEHLDHGRRPRRRWGGWVPASWSTTRRATRASQLDPSVWELPGAMPEIAPSPDFGSNMEKKFTERSSVLQAWGAYGILWPVVHYQLGVSPDLGRGRVSVVPQVPSGQSSVSGRQVRLGSGWVDVSASAEREGAAVRRTAERALAPADRRRAAPRCARLIGGAGRSCCPLPGGRDSARSDGRGGRWQSHRGERPGGAAEVRVVRRGRLEP